MSITNLLLGVILLILVQQFYPSVIKTLGPVLIAVLALYCVYWLVARFPAQRRKAEARKLQEAEDEAAFWEHHCKHDAIRKKFDPENIWNEATQLPGEYLKEMRDLNLEYRGMLQRRNGWTQNDFES